MFISVDNYLSTLFNYNELDYEKSKYHILKPIYLKGNYLANASNVYTFLEVRLYFGC